MTQDATWDVNSDFECDLECDLEQWHHGERGVSVAAARQMRGNGRTVDRQTRQKLKYINMQDMDGARFSLARCRSRSVSRVTLVVQGNST